MTIRRADFHIWKGELTDKTCLEPISKRGKDWIAANLEGPATDSVIFLVDTTSLKDLIRHAEAGSLVIAYGKPAY